MTYEQMQKRQLRLSALLAVLFLATMFSIPFLNHLIPRTMLTVVFGIPLCWLVVGILLHLEFWIIAFVYAYHSNRWEDELSDE
ncbi:MAG: DUF485 domain-containing protein [Armatimonadetes bacterium]|nr:DUF485 domain-containing protein [Armatimonadota bacterium]